MMMKWEGGFNLSKDYFSCLTHFICLRLLLLSRAYYNVIIYRVLLHPIPLNSTQRFLIDTWMTCDPEAITPDQTRPPHHNA